jgi:DNA-directed RNA polymerase alpha subunit
MDITPKRLTVTVAQTVGILGLSSATIWTMLRDGRLESIAFGRRRLILYPSIEKFVESLRGIPGDARRNGTVPPLGATNAKKKGRKELDLATSVRDLGLSTRATNALINDGVRTLRDLIPKTEAELLLIPNFGKICVGEVEALLAKRGLHLSAPAE